jgi:uncharacterized protein YndB with AHSA1/START domain
MAQIRKSITIKAPLDKVFEYMNEPSHFPEIWPSMVEVSNVVGTPTGGHEFDWVYKMAGMKFRGHTTTIEFENNRKLTAKNEKGIPSTFRWTYAGENGGVRVAVEVDYTLPNAVLDKFAEPFLRRLNEREAETVLENLKLRMELGMPQIATDRPEKRPNPR